MKITTYNNKMILYIFVVFLTTVLQYLNSNFRFMSYAMIIFLLCICIVKNKKIMSDFVNQYKYIVIWLAWILTLTCLIDLIKYGTLMAGAIIQPLFIVGTIYISYYFAHKYDKHYCEKVLFLFYLVILFAAVMGLIEFFTKKNLFFPSYGNPWEEYRVSSLFKHPIIYAAMLLIGVFYSLFFLKKPIVKYFSLIIFLVGIYSSKSRSLWISLIFGFLILVLASFSHKIKKNTVLKLFIIIGLGFIFLISPLGSQMVDNIISRFTNMSDTVDSIQRLGTIEYFSNLLYNEGNFITLFLGHGEDAASIVMLNTTIQIENFSTTDNQYVLFLYNYGLIVLIFIVLMLIKACVHLIVNYKSINRIERFILITIITQSIGAFFYELTEVKSVSFLVFVLIGFELSFLSKNFFPVKVKE